MTQTMGSTVSACLATPFKIKGVNYSISSACSTSAHCIGNAMEQIQLGKQDVVFAGGGEELDWTMSAFSMPWVRYRPNTMTLLRKRPALTMPIAMAS